MGLAYSSISINICGMDGWMDGWIGGWMDRQMDGLKINGREERWTEKQMNRGPLPSPAVS